MTGTASGTRAVAARRGHSRYRAGPKTDDGTGRPSNGRGTPWPQPEPPSQPPAVRRARRRRRSLTAQHRDGQGHGSSSESTLTPTADGVTSHGVKGSQAGPAPRIMSQCPAQWTGPGHITASVTSHAGGASPSDRHGDSR